MRLFLYGTLLHRPVIARIAGPAVAAAIRPATLAGWRRVALPGGRYPTLRRGPGRVDGAVVEVAPPALARLCAYEGAAYRLLPVRVRTAGRDVRAHAWIAPGGTARAWTPRNA